MKLFNKETYISRRQKLKETLRGGQALIMGNNEAPMNYTANAYRFRQDSNFLYYFGINLPGLAALIDVDKDEEIIFGHELTLDDIIWEGPVEPLSVLAEKVGVKTIKPLADLAKYLRNPRFLPPYRGDRTLLLRELLSENAEASVELIKAVVAQRSIKTQEEILEMTAAVNATRDMHIAAMKITKPGLKEYDIVAEILRTAKKHDADLAYPAIVTVNGQTLHNHHHHNTLLDGKLLLNDSGTESPMFYAGDITRTLPVNGKFSTKQREVYDIVLQMEEDSIAMLKPGVKYLDVHIQSSHILLEGLKSLGLVNGDTSEMVEAGVAGLFMPHGLGHAIGLDVHDMEDLGEKYVGYREGLERSTLMGLKSLRLAKELEAGNVLTVEPGCYFIPELIHKYKSEGTFSQYVNFSKLEYYLDFGGVRIEDNILVSQTGHEVLGDLIPKTADAVEETMKS